MSSSLSVIEALLQEFNHHTTPSARRREIETQLIALKSQPESWHTFLRVVATASNFQTNTLLWYFCGSALEQTITRRWSQLSNADRELLRDTLWNTFSELSTSAAGDAHRSQRNNYAHLIALIGKREFPDLHANYMMHCYELLKSKFLLGVTLLRNTSEEVVSNREDVTTDRKEFFRSSVSMFMTDMMNLITEYLIIAVCHINGKDIHSIPNNTFPVNYTLLTTLPNDNQLSCSVVELLVCVQHLVSWIKLDEISNYFIMSILDLAQSRSGGLLDVSLAALAVLNELLYLQRPLPHVMLLMDGVNGLLEQHNSNSSSKQQSEIYADKFRELLRLYTVKFWPKMLQETELLNCFLKSLYCYTICKNGALDLTEKLEIWTPIIKGLANDSKLNYYNDIMHQLVAEIMRRTLFEHNKSELELIDNELVEDDDVELQTELQHFLTQCFECIALIAASRPNAVFAQVFSYWSRPNVILLGLANAADGGGVSADFTRKLRHTALTEQMCDSATICQAVVRIAPLLESNAPSNAAAEVNNQLRLLTDNLLTMLHFLASNKLETLQSNFNLVFCRTNLDNLYAQVLCAVRSILPLSVLHMKPGETLQDLYNDVGSILLPNAPLCAQIVALAASQLLICISSVIRPNNLLEVPSIVALMQAGPRLTHLPRQIISNIFIGLISHIVLPWKAVATSEQDFVRRAALLRSYVENVAQNFLELDLNTSGSDSSKAAPITSNLLCHYTEVIAFFVDSSNQTKDMLCAIFKPILTKALMIYNHFGLNGCGSDNQIAQTVADFSLAMLRSLPSQLGAAFIKEMVSLYIAMCSGDNLSINGVNVLEKILQMFQLIVEQPGNASLSLLPAILEFTIAQILPLLQPSTGKSVIDNSDAAELVYALLNSILLCKWHYFYKPHVHHNGSLQQTSSENAHPQQFVAILSAYGQMLVRGNDTNVVRTVLQSMQCVNERWRLYQRPLFREALLASFQNALINMLLSGKAALHWELLANALFAMGQADGLKLRESFVAAGFPANAKVIDDICLTTDIPTFSHLLTQLAQDAHCVHLTQP